MDLDVNDNTFKVNVIDSNQFEPKEFASCEIPFEDSLMKPDECLPGLMNRTRMMRLLSLRQFLSMVNLVKKFSEGIL